MATPKKPAKAAKPAAKKTTVKKTAAKPAAKKAPAKKPAVKKPAKPAAKKAPAKKPAVKAKPVKKAVVKKAPAKKPAVKKAPAKPAAKAPAKKPAAKPAVKAPAKKPEVKPAAVKTPAPVQKKEPVKKIPAVKPVQPQTVASPAPVSGPALPNLFDAYNQNTLPKDKGIIIKSSFRENSKYAIYEVTAYSGIKELVRVDNGLRFECAGAKKLHILTEPSDYFFKGIHDPDCRSVTDKIPYRRDELDVFTAFDQTLIMVAKEPREAESVFTVTKPVGDNFVVVYPVNPGVHQVIGDLFNKLFSQELNISHTDTEKAAQMVSAVIRKLES